MNRYSSSLVFLLVSYLASLCSAQQLLRSGFTSEDQKTKILNLHNKLRNLVASGKVPTQPAAQNMREMVWDEQLAERSQKWADGCVFEHEPNRVNEKGQALGQCLCLIPLYYEGKLEAPRVEDAVQLWFDEVYKFGYNGTMTVEAGHYSQMIWGETYKVGCGYSDFKEGDFVNQYLVCDYFPSGNMIGGLPYEYGAPNCAKNNLFKSSKYENLCTINKDLINSCAAGQR